MLASLMLARYHPSPNFCMWMCDKTSFLKRIFALKVCFYQLGVVGDTCPHALQVHHHQGPQVVSIMGSFSVCDHSRKQISWFSWNEATTKSWASQSET